MILLIVLLYLTVGAELALISTKEEPPRRRNAVIIFLWPLVLLIKTTKLIIRIIKWFFSEF